MRTFARLRHASPRLAVGLILASALGTGGEPAAAQDREARGSEIPASPEDGGPRRWAVAVEGALNLRDGPSVSARIVDRLKPGDVLSNLGCETGADRVWCYVQRFRGGPVGYAASAFLEPAVDPSGEVLYGPDDAPMRAALEDFDATGSIACGRTATEPTLSCGFGVARARGGDATVVATFPDGFRRTLFFTRGEFMSADASEAGGGFDTEARRDGDDTVIRVDEERYVVPDAVIFGG